MTRTDEAAPPPPPPPPPLPQLQPEGEAADQAFDEGLNRARRFAGGGGRGERRGVSKRKVERERLGLLGVKSEAKKTRGGRVRTRPRTPGPAASSGGTAEAAAVGGGAADGPVG